MGVVWADVEAEDGALRVSWELDRDEAVDLGSGPTPEAVDHTHVLTVGPGSTTALVPVDPSWPRGFVSVSPVGGGGALVVGQRRLPFEGVTNFRDLGGYPTGFGARTRWGLVFRSDALHRFTEQDRAAYQRLGLSAVWDLRGDLEREIHPNPFPSRHVPLLSGVTPPSAMDHSDPDAGAEVGDNLLLEMYRGMLEAAGPLFGTLLGGLAEPAGLPAVFHCAGGKDRTGMGAALLLELLGVPRETVLDDYQLTSRYRLREHQAESYENLLASGLPPEAAVAVLGAPRAAMAGALETLDQRHRGVEAYLTGPAGLAPRTLDRVRQLLLS